MARVEGLTTPLPVWWGRSLTNREIKKILIRGTNWIGDAVMTLPALRALKEAFPSGHLTVLAKPWVAEIYRLSRLTDDIILYENPGRHGGTGGMLKLCHELRKRHFEAAILFQNAIEAAIIACVACIPIRAGYDSDGRLFFLTHAVRRKSPVRRLHQTHYYLEMVRALGVKVTYTIPRIFPPPDTPLPPVGENLIGMAPGAQYGPAKRWYPQRFAALADRLISSLSARVILLGSKTDREVTEEVRKYARHELFDLTGKTTLTEAIGIMSHCKVFVTNDSGLMHVACALGIPVVAIFGSTDPSTTGPVGEKARVIYHPVSCSPCLKTSCPSDFRCMDLVGVDEVYLAVKELWEMETCN